MPLSEEATFDHFFVSEGNKATIAAIRSFIQQSEPFFFLWGIGSGVTHVLQAIQQENAHHQMQYLPLAELIQHPADDVLAGLEVLDVIILDDLHMIAGLPEWELAVFHLYNRLRDMGKQLIVGSQIAPRELAIDLADLHSRLQWGMSYSLTPLTDEEKRQALLLRSQGLGLRVSDEVMQFMLNHYSRDLRQLMPMLQTMDNASLSEQRHLTIPFIKQIMQMS